MKKYYIIASILILTTLFFIGMRFYTKSFSPQLKVFLDSENYDISIDYNQPYKKNRKIFGGLVPYGQIWRTGANEPTVFSTDMNLKIGNDVLRAGSYALFTIPMEDKWQVIFNKNIPQWGISMFSGEVNRDKSADELVIEVPSIKSQEEIEKFTIDFEKVDKKDFDMVLMWERTMVVISFHVID